MSTTTVKNYLSVHIKNSHSYCTRVFVCVCVRLKASCTTLKSNKMHQNCTVLNEIHLLGFNNNLIIICFYTKTRSRGATLAHHTVTHSVLPLERCNQAEMNINTLFLFEATKSHTLSLLQLGKKKINGNVIFFSP